VELRVLGPVTATRSGEPIALGGPKPRAVLARLALAEGAVVATHQLIEDIWGDDDTDRTGTLQVHVSALRRSLRGADDDASIHFVHGGYRISGPLDLDLNRFQAAVRTAEAAFEEERFDAAGVACRAALDEWHGTEALAGLDDAPFVTVQRAALGRRYDEVFERRVAADLAVGRLGSLSAELEQQLRRAPYREPAWALLARVAYATSGSAAALDALRRAREALVGDLGLDPGPELEDLEQRILRHEPSLQAVSPARVRARPPRPTSPLVGRDDELVELLDLLDDPATAMVTLTGPGGVGKTSLALELAARWAQLGRSVSFVSLEPLDSSAEIERFIANEVGRDLTASDGPLDELIVLDNVEHLVDGAAEIGNMAASASTRCWLITSRVPLRTRAEIERRVEPLATADAVVCFRAAAARLGATNPSRDSDDGGVIEELCRRLDGLPLALELAAGATRHRPLDAVLEGLEDVMDATCGPVDAPKRHRSVVDAVRWSTEALGPAERRALRGLSVFAESFTAADAAAVLDEPDAERSVQALADASLLARGDHGPGSFRMLATVRAAVRGELDTNDGSVYRLRRARHVLAVTGALADTDDEGRVEAYDQIDKRLLDLADTVRSGAELAMLDEVADVVAALDDYWIDRGHSRLAEELLEHIVTWPLLGARRAAALAQRLRVRWFNLSPIDLDEVDLAIASCREESLEGWLSTVARVAVDVALEAGSDPRPFGEMAIEAARLAGGPNLAYGLAARGGAAWYAEEPDEVAADRFTEQALEEARRSGGARAVSLCAATRAEVLLWRHDLAAAAPLVEEALAAALLSGSRYAEMVALSYRVSTRRLLGDVPGARASAVEALACAERIGLREQIAVAIAEAAMVEAEAEDHRRAAFLLGTIDSSLPTQLALSRVGERDLAELRRRVDDGLGVVEAAAARVAGRRAGLAAGVGVVRGGALPAG
jgi:DNA-binding SARP family transcriptional activator